MRSQTTNKSIAAIYLKVQFLIIVISIVSCQNHHKSDSIVQKRGDTSKAFKLSSIDSTEYSDKWEFQDSVFELIRNYHGITDTLDFIARLKTNCHIIAPYPGKQTISVLEDIVLYGSKKKFYLVEYNWGADWPNTEFPWKKQILFDNKGRMIKVLGALRYELLKVFPNQNPFLLAVISTAHGNGEHQLYRMDGDSIRNVIGGFKDYFPKTYDADHDNNVNDPYEMKLIIKDINGDGLNDLSFIGTIKHSIIDMGENDQKIPVVFNFFYNEKSQLFIEQQDYSKKYSYLENYK